MRSRALLADLQRLVRRLEADLAERAAAEPAMAAHLEAEHRRAREAERTAEPFETFRAGLLTQAAVAWVLACVFVRFLEDNGFLDGGRLPRPAGAGEAAGAGTVPAAREMRRFLSGATPDLLRLARESERLHYAARPRENERDYLLAVFAQVAELPGMKALLGREHNPLWALTLSADGARDLVELLRRVDPETGEVVHPFESPERDTRFQGDLYQDLSEAARKRYALLQTPEFVEELLLARTLERAVEDHGSAAVTLIDPACGSGHFLLGAFRRLFAHAVRREPHGNLRALAQGVLHQLAGVDVNPFAAAIARFRLLIAALAACGVERLVDAPAFELQVAAGDSLLHGERSPLAGGVANRPLFGRDPYAHFYESEDGELLRKLLSKRYHVVVGNPPYITVKDKGLNELYRRRFPTSCYRQYSLVCPFLERFFDLAVAPPPGKVSPAGYVGAIVANSFMKREFGKKLIEEVLAKLDVTHVIDASGAYIPGHGTPTVILIGRNRAPVDKTVRAVLGIRGEPAVPEDPAKGVVWSAIFDQLDRPGSESAYVSAVDLPRERLAKHPWSLGGGGALQLKGQIETAKSETLARVAREIGFGAVTREDEVYLIGVRVGARQRIHQANLLPLVEGDSLRDWTTLEPTKAIWPYDAETLAPSASVAVARFLWPWKPQLSQRVAYGQTQLQRGLEWFEYSMFFTGRFRQSLSLAFAFVATHNHFVLDRGGKVFKQSAPVIKLPAQAGEDDHLALLGLLNSSTACFWMKQVFHNKGARGQGGGFTSQEWEQFFEFDSTKLLQFPLPAGRPTERARALDALAREAADSTPAALAAREVPTAAGLEAADSTPAALAAREVPAAAGLEAARVRWESLRRRMIGLQEELDWEVYRLYGLLAEDLTLPADSLPEVALGERAFEIALARRVEAGEEETEWFARHGSTPRTDLPSGWPDAYRRLVERRLEAIAAVPEIGLIERPEYKRRWAVEPWEDQVERALRSWLLDRLEAPALWPAPRLTSAARLADLLRRDRDFTAVAALYRGGRDFDLTSLLVELIESEGVSYLPEQRYTAAGLAKRALWERAWDLQRAEDSIDARTRPPQGHPARLTEEQASAEKARAVGDIPVPPKYQRTDFRSAASWRLRGKLDVPKERFILYPGAEREADPSPVLGWAGWTHLQQAEALATYAVEMREREGWPRERLLPLLQGLRELIPWLKQWHNDPDPRTGQRLGDYYESFVEEEGRGLGVKPASA